MEDAIEKQRLNFDIETLGKVFEELTDGIISLYSKPNLKELIVSNMWKDRRLHHLPESLIKWYVDFRFLLAES